MVYTHRVCEGEEECGRGTIDTKLVALRCLRQARRL